jgi:hypothetical protein
VKPVTVLESPAGSPPGSALDEAWITHDESPNKSMGEFGDPRNRKILIYFTLVIPPLGTNFFRKAPADDAEFKADILPELIHLVVVRGWRSLIAVLRLARRGSVRTSI